MLGGVLHVAGAVARAQLRVPSARQPRRSLPLRSTVTSRDRKMTPWRWSVRPAAPVSSMCWTASSTKGLSSTRGFVCPWSASTSSQSRRALSSRQSTPISGIPKQSDRPGRHHVQPSGATLPHDPRNEPTMTTMAAEATDPLAHRRWFTSRSSLDVIPQPDPDARAKGTNRSASRLRIAYQHPQSIHRASLARGTGSLARHSGRTA